MDRLESAGPEKNLGSKFRLFWDFASIICLRWFGWNGRRARRRKRRRKKERRKKTFGDYCLPGLHENVCFREETKINEKQSFPVSDETLTCSSFVFLLFLLSFSFFEESFDERFSFYDQLNDKFPGMRGWLSMVYLKSIRFESLVYFLPVMISAFLKVLL